MPYRKLPFANNHYYHVLNRSFNKKENIFINANDLERIVLLIQCYCYSNFSYTFSKFIKLPHKLQQKIMKSLLEKQDYLVKIIAFCFMPNHYHLLVKQVKDRGIINFASNFQNSYAKYFNLKYDKYGPLFRGRFQAKIVTDDSQLLHLHRYIHLNPYSAGLVNKNTLLTYPWSSLPQYLTNINVFCHPLIILNHFKNTPNYKKFILDQADYQKELQKIKHLALEQQNQPRG